MSSKLIVSKTPTPITIIFEDSDSKVIFKSAETIDSSVMFCPPEINNELRVYSGEVNVGGIVKHVHRELFIDGKGSLSEFITIHCANSSIKKVNLND